MTSTDRGASPSYQAISMEVDGPRATVVLRWPEALNALTPGMLGGSGTPSTGWRRIRPWWPWS